MLSLFKPKKPDFKWPVTVDMHCHILPGIDDGSPDVGTSLELLDKLSTLGYSHIICTPHVLPGLYPNNAESIQSAFNTLNAAIKRNNSPVKIKASGEYMLDDVFLKNLEKGEKLLPLANKILLTEFSFFQPPPNLKEICFGLLTNGYQPILAHPERYPYYYNDTRIFHFLKDLGFAFQLNLLSLTGQYGASTVNTAKYLIKEKLYDYLGTDLHHHTHLSSLQHPAMQHTISQFIPNYFFKNAELLFD